MKHRLDGKRIAFLMANDGVEQVELVTPLEAVRGEGGTAEILAPKGGRIQAFNHLDRADTFPVDRPVGEADPSDYDGLMLPGGVANPDRLRMDPDAVAFVRSFIDARKPVAAICHAPWTLVEADVVRGRTITSFPSLRTDIENAGGHWVYEQMHDDDGLVTSRKPGDLPAFCEQMVMRFAETPVMAS